jgi:hypothetical protein
VEPGPHRANGHALDLGDLGQGHPEVVLQHDGCALIGGQPPKRPIELITVGHFDLRTVHDQWKRKEADCARSTPLPP